MNVRCNVDVAASASLELGERQLRALDALSGYGDDAFLKVFYEHLGEHYMKPHEAGLRELFALIRRDVPPVLSKIDSARKAIRADAAPKATP